MKIDWKSIVGTVAPTIATALGGPLAGLATKAVTEALGLPATSGEEEIAAAVKGATPEQLLALKNVDASFKVKMKELDVNLEEILFKDRDSARQMQALTRARTPAVLSWVIVLVTLLLEGYILVDGVPKGVDQVIAGRILGTFDTALITVVTFWLGAAHRDPANRGLG